MSDDQPKARPQRKPLSEKAKQTRSANMRKALEAKKQQFEKMKAYREIAERMEQQGTSYDVSTDDGSSGASGDEASYDSSSSEEIYIKEKKKAGMRNTVQDAMNAMSKKGQGRPKTQKPDPVTEQAINQQQQFLDNNPQFMYLRSELNELKRMVKQTSKKKEKAPKLKPAPKKTKKQLVPIVVQTQAPAPAPAQVQQAFNFAEELRRNIINLKG